MKFRTFLAPFERTKHLGFESQLKKLNFSLLLLLPRQLQNMFETLHFWVEVCK